MADDELRIICGPTAAGKSALALDLAARTGAVIVSADSRQVYRGFDIGTAKPTPAERARVAHRGIDVADPTTRYSAAAWAADAAGWIAEARRDGRPAVVVGGTGFYIRALTAPLFTEPAMDAERRQALAAELALLSTPALRRWCERLDSARSQLGRAQLLRAVEVALLTGRPLSSWHKEAGRTTTMRARYLLVDPGELLAARIAQRIEAMLEAGWAEEAAALDARLPADAPAWSSTGYDAMREVAHGRLTRQAAAARVQIETRQYAKRQRTWFRHQLPAAAVTALDPTSANAAERAVAWWTS